MEYLAIDDLQFGPANPTAPTLASISASNIGTSTATLNGTVNANGLTTTSQSFQYSLSPTLATGVTTVAATPTTTSGSSVTNISANLSALSPNTTYYYRTIATNCHGNKYSSISSFTTTSVASTNADLSALTISSGTLAPSFAAITTAYTASVTNAISSITVTPTKADANATIQVQVNSGGYATVTSGSASSALSLNLGTNTIDVKVTAQNGTTIKTYTITVTRAAAVAAITPPGNALSFDGTNDYVQTTAIGSPISGNCTLEAWVLPKHATNTICFLSTREPQEYTFDAKLEGGNKILVDFGNGSNSWGAGNSGLLSFDYAYTINKWQHIAIVVNGTNCSLYVNGALIATKNIGFTPMLFNSTSYLKIGAVQGVQYFNGNIDEVRIWSISRTAIDIQNNFKDTVARNSSGLFAYYRFDEGTAGTTNTGITSLPNLASSSLTGTLTNVALTGTSSNWVESYAMAIPTATAATSITSTGFTANWTAPTRGTVDNGYRLEVSTDTTFATGAIAGSPFTISSGTSRAITGLTAGTKYFYRVVADKTSVTGQGGYSATIVANTVMPLVPPGNALSFDGTNDYVQTTALGSVLSSNFTLEAWILPKHATNTICFLSTREPQEYTFDAKLDGGNKILVDLGNGANSWGSGLLSFDYIYSINKWMHIAIAVSGTNCSLYVNGTLIATKNIGFNPVLFNTTSYLKIGAVQGVQYFNGNIDEVRIWNTSRTATDIQNNFKDTIARNSAGLLAYYRFDEGTAGSTNTGLTSLPNLVGSSLTGTLNNIALTGSSSNYVESYAMAIPTATAATSITGTGFTANWTAPLLA